MGRFHVVHSGTEYHLGRRTALNELLEELQMRLTHQSSDGLLNIEDVRMAVDHLLLKEVPFMIDKKKLGKHG